MERLKLEFYYGQEAEQFTFYRLPKALITDNRFKDISNNSKLLYGLMLDRMSLSVRSGWFDDQNRVYIKYSLKSIMEDLNCSKMTAVGLLKELQAIGLVDIEQRNGLANIIYVKNFVSGDEGQALDRSENCTGSVEKLYFSKNWMKQRLGIFDEQVVAKNNNSVNRFIESMNWTDTTAGRRDDNISASYVKVDTNQALQFIESIEEIFQHEPFDIKYLKMLLQEEQEIFFIKMPDNDGKGRKRTFYTDNIINNIHKIKSICFAYC